MVSCYIPCFNNASTLAQVIASIRNQQNAVAELFVVDDGSSDSSVEIARSLGVHVHEQGINLGRGATRHRAMQEASYDLVLCCDATNVLPYDFLANALAWMTDANVAAAFGFFINSPNNGLPERWRGRHLFKSSFKQEFSRKASLITSGALIRKSICEAVGGFNPALRHSEDVDIGVRLLESGYDVVFDPQMQISSIAANSIIEVLDRYWRWYAGKEELITFKGYLRQIVYSIKVMVPQDIAERDFLSAPISLFSPHYQFWKSLIRRISGSSQAS